MLSKDVSTSAYGENANITYYGLSTDEKPIAGVKNGSAFIEMDTSKVYFFDEQNSQWHEWGG